MASSRVAKRIERAVSDQRLVKVTRKKGWDRLDGSVQLLGNKWLLMAIQVDAGFNGHALVRTSDIQSIKIDPNGDFVKKALLAEGQWPLPELDGISLTTTKAVLQSASQVAQLVTVYYEQDHPDECLIGIPRKFGPKKFSLQMVSTGAKWLNSDAVFSYRSVTRIDLGGAYEKRLSVVAGPAPYTDRQ